MRSKTTLFALAAVLTAAGAGAFAATADATRRMDPVSTTIREIIDGLDRSIRLEMAGCRRTDAHGRPARCDDGAADAALHDDAMAAIDALTSRAPQERGGAEARIRRFTKKAAPELTYLGTTSDPYRDDGSRIESYADDSHEYWVDPATDSIVQVGPRPDRHTPPFKDREAGRLTVPELRERALAIIAQEIPGFEGKRSRFHPLEDNKDREIYFFRWDDARGPMREDALPPFVQVGLWADGELASYTNTLTE